MDRAHVAWEYEPTLFILEQDEHGNCKLGFRPDFYLPDFDLYIEVTGMKQAHTTTKHRKARLARERHGVKVELIHRADLKRVDERIAEIISDDEARLPGPRSAVM